MTRILNVDEMDYFPMRKQYHLEDATREDKEDKFFGRSKFYFGAFTFFINHVEDFQN